MTFILDMATGSEYPREAAGYQDAGAVKAHHPGRVREPQAIELRLAIIESTPAHNQSSVLPPGIDTTKLISTIDD